MPTWISEIFTMIYRDLLVPAIGIIIVVILNRLTSKANTVMDSANDRNKKESINAVSSITTQAMAQLDSVVSSAVAFTMKLAEVYKSDETPKLTEAEMTELNDRARELSYRMLPTEITGGSLLTLLGGEDALKTLIDSSIEKQVLAIRSKSK